MKLRFEHGSRDDLKTLHPAYFALVMATGIVALAADLHGLDMVATALFWLNAVFFAGLIGATALRLKRYPQAFAADWQSHSRGVGFFTLVAAFGVFGTQLVLQMHAMDLALACWVVAALLWLTITYGVLAALTVRQDKPGLADGLNGGWLVIVVATQSVSILTDLILPADASGDLHVMLVFAAMVLWLGGGALYFWLMTLIFLRSTFLRMSAEDLTPPYWINMGAVAISTLAGATLLGRSALSPDFAELVPFVKGLTLLFWAIGSWWIPMLLVLGVWRYLIRGVPFAYDPLYWGGVFPLGMYSVCTYHLAEVMEVPFLLPLSYAFMLAAIAAWTATFIGFLDSRLYAGARRLADLERPVSGSDIGAR